MNKLEESSTLSHLQVSELPGTSAREENTLRAEVEKALGRFFAQLEDEPVTDLHQMVMCEVEEPLLQAVMNYTGNNQSKASIMLGMNRGTLRTKLKQYGML